MAGLTNAVLVPLLETRPHMRVLKFRNCAALTDTTVLTIAEHCCRELRVLEVSGAAQVTNRSVCEVTRKCQYLQTLNVAGCSVTDSLLHIIAQSCFRLRSLNVLNCKAVSQLAIAQFLMASPQVEEFTCSAFELLDSF